MSGRIKWAVPFYKERHRLGSVGLAEICSKFSPANTTS